MEDRQTINNKFERARRGERVTLYVTSNRDLCAAKHILGQKGVGHWIPQGSAEYGSVDVRIDFVMLSDNRPTPPPTEFYRHPPGKCPYTSDGTCSGHLREPGLIERRFVEQNPQLK